MRFLRNNTIRIEEPVEIFVKAEPKTEMPEDNKATQLDFLSYGTCSKCVKFQAAR